VVKDRNRLAHRQGDAINPVLAAAGYNLRLILKWIRLLFDPIRIWTSQNNQTRSVQIASRNVFFTTDCS
jgi:hypothetical protein